VVGVSRSSTCCVERKRRGIALVPLDLFQIFRFFADDLAVLVPGGEEGERKEGGRWVGAGDVSRLSRYSTGRRGCLVRNFIIGLTLPVCHIQERRGKKAFDLAPTAGLVLVRLDIDDGPLAPGGEKGGERREKKSEAIKLNPTIASKSSDGRGKYKKKKRKEKKGGGGGGMPAPCIPYQDVQLCRYPPERDNGKGGKEKALDPNTISRRGRNRLPIFGSRSGNTKEKGRKWGATSAFSPDEAVCRYRAGIFSFRGDLIVQKRERGKKKGKRYWLVILSFFKCFVIHDWAPFWSHPPPNNKKRRCGSRQRSSLTYLVRPEKKERSAVHWRWC